MMIASYMAALLLVGIGVAHSVLGERYVLRRVQRLTDLPKLRLGGRELMVPVLRFAWHITSIAWFGFAAMLVLIAHGALSSENGAMVIAVTFLVCALCAGIASRGRHYSWVVFLMVGVLAMHRALFSS